MGLQPHLVEELKVDDVEVRLRCVKLLLQMFTEPGSTLLDQYEPLFNELLGRYNDSAPEIRTIMVDKSAQIDAMISLKNRSKVAQLSVLKIFATELVPRPEDSNQTANIDKRIDVLSRYCSDSAAESELRKLVVRDVKGGAKDSLEDPLFMLNMDTVGRDKMMTIMALLAAEHSKAYAFKRDESDEMDEDEDKSAKEYTNESMLNSCQQVADALPDAFKSCFTALHSLIMNVKKEDRKSGFSMVDDSAIPVERVFALLTKTGHLFLGELYASAMHGEVRNCPNFVRPKSSLNRPRIGPN